MDDEAERDYLENQCLDYQQNPYLVLVKKEAYHILHEAIKALPANQKQRLYRYFWEQKSYSAIARLEGVDESAIRRSVKRRLLQLRKKLIDTGISTNDVAQCSTTRYVKPLHLKKETADRQNKSISLININEVSKKLVAFWRDEAQQN